MRAISISKEKKEERREKKGPIALNVNKDENGRQKTHFYFLLTRVTCEA